MARLLAIGPEQKKAIAKAIRYAEAHVVPLERIKAMMAGNAPPAGDYKGHVVDIPVGFRCVYSVEMQPFGKARHLSVSVEDETGKVPSPDVMNVIAAEFGFVRGKIQGMWIEQERAVNMVQAFNMCQSCKGQGLMLQQIKGVSSLKTCEKCRGRGYLEFI